MSFWSSDYDTKNHHHHQQHHAKNPNNWETSNGKFQGSAAFNNGYVYFLDPPPMQNYNQDQEYEKPLVCVKVGNQKICKESVDDVTEEFIKLEHKKFGYNKWMNAG